MQSPMDLASQVLDPKNLDATLKVLAGGFLQLVLFIVPGFIFERVLSAFIPRIRTTGTDLAFETTAYACGYYGLVVLPVGLAFWGLSHMPCFQWLAGPPWWFEALAMPVVLLLGPVVSALGYVRLRDSSAIESFVRWVTGRPIVAPTAWDDAMAGSPSTRWVIVTLRDGAKIAGEWSYDHAAGDQPPSHRMSAAGGTPYPHDLYLWRIYELEPDGSIGPVYSPTRSIWIHQDQIATVELIDLR